MGLMRTEVVVAKGKPLPPVEFEWLKKARNLTKVLLTQLVRGGTVASHRTINMLQWVYQQQSRNDAKSKSL